MPFLVYKIINKKTGLIYIGSTTMSLKMRFSRHLSINSGSSNRLYVDIKYIGRDFFEIFLLEECLSKSHMLTRESFWMKEYKSINPKFGYNIRLTGYASQEVSEKSKQISREIKSHFWTQGKLCRMIEMSESDFSKKVNGISKFKKSDIDKINAALGTTFKL